MENGMHEWMQKAEVLIEALPYIQRFNRKIVVVKYTFHQLLDYLHTTNSYNYLC